MKDSEPERRVHLSWRCRHKASRSLSSTWRDKSKQVPSNVHDDHRANLFGGKILVISPLSIRAYPPRPAHASPTPASSPSPIGIDAYRNRPSPPAWPRASPSLWNESELEIEGEGRGEERPPIRRHYRCVLGYVGGESGPISLPAAGAHRVTSMPTPYAPFGPLRGEWVRGWWNGGGVWGIDGGV